MSKKVLLVENNAFLINIYANQLRKYGYSTSIASDGEIAVKRIKSIGPDLLILNCILAGQGEYSDGFSVLKKIREDASLKDLKVVMLSNFIQEQKTADNDELGILRYFSKTEHTAEEIVKGIKQILS